MGSGHSGSLLAGISSLISSPYVLFAAAAVVVIAVLIVLFMVLRGGSKKSRVASEFEEDQPEAWESAPRGAAGQPNQNYQQQEQMFPWQGGGPRTDGGRQPAGSKRGPGGRDAPSDWEQPNGYSQREGQWNAPAQPAARGGQWGGTDDWGAAAPAAMGRNGADPRAFQSQPAGRESEQGWGGAPAAPGGQGAWDQAPTAMPGRGREQEQWGQPPAARGREQDQWGQPPAQNEWSQQAPTHGRDPAQNEWGQQPASRSQEQGQWGQPPTQNEWGQQPAARGREQDQWGQPMPAMGRGTEQPESLGGGSRRGQEAPSRPDGQWDQGNWAAGGAAGMSRQPGSGDGPNEWGQPRFDRQPAGQPSSGWEQSAPPAWQAPPQQEPSAWQNANWKQSAPEQTAPRGGQPTSRPQAPAQWGQASGPSGAPAWETSGAAEEWNQPAQPSKPSTSRPGTPSGPSGASQPPIARDTGGEWGERDLERPTMRPMQPASGWESRDVLSRSASQDAAPAAWQAPIPLQTSGAFGGATAPAERRGPDMRSLGNASPDITAYSVPASEADEGEAAKTVVMRKNAAGERIPAIVIRQGKEPGRTYEMLKEQITIGRSRESDIFLEDLAVSRLHATIYRDEMGGYRLRDEHSANGTSLNGQRLSAEVALQEGDEVQLGQTILAFVRR